MFRNSLTEPKLFMTQTHYIHFIYKKIVIRFRYRATYHALRVKGVGRGISAPVNLHMLDGEIKKIHIF